MMWFSGIYGIASSIALMGLFDSYLFIKSGNLNSFVGVAESISGITQVIVVLPAGYLVDRFPRASLLRVCGVLSCVYVVVASLGILWDDNQLIYLSLILGGIYAALQNTTSFALFSDSIPQGSRSLWMTRVAVISQVAMGFGPGISMILLHYLGNDWDLTILHFVLIAGFLLMIPANIFLFGWEDIQQSASPSVGLSMESDAPLLPANERRKLFSIVPYMICLNDLMTCIGAGMTVKFFPLFFKNDYGFSPIDLQALFCVYCLAFALFTWLCERVAAGLGRVQSTMIFSALGVACLFLLAYLQNLPLVIFIFILRGAFSNSIYPIDRSILQDYISSSTRGRWNSIESISAMTWSGSAVIGGYLMDSHDYRYTFVITGWIYLVACVFRIPLLWLVPKKEKFVQAKIVSANQDIMKSPIAPSPLMFSQ
jgi:MFS family permease